MSDTETGIILESSAGKTTEESAAGYASVVKLRTVSTGVTFSRLGNGRISVSAHDGCTSVALVIEAVEAMEMAEQLKVIAAPQ